MKKIEDNYFLDVDDKMLDFLEQESEKCIKHLNAELSKKKENAYKLLNFYILGVGASFLLVTQSLGYNPIVQSLMVFCLGWVCCIGLLIQFCIKNRSKPAMGNSPLGLYSQYYKELDSQDKLHILRRYNLSTAEDVIKMLINENEKIADWLNRVFYLSIAVPVISGIIYFAQYF